MTVRFMLTGAAALVLLCTACGGSADDAAAECKRNPPSTVERETPAWRAICRLDASNPPTP